VKHTTATRKNSTKTRFITQGLWPAITTAVMKASGRCDAAVAYFGRGGARRLPLSRGGTLVVDMSLAAVKSGQTRPADVLPLLRKGVAVYSVDNLHAKVVVAGRRAFVGSANVSNRSARHLVEAAIETADPAAVRASRAFVRSLAGEPVTPNFARDRQKLYRPPRFVRGGGR
jgi:hypothetical protein